MQSKNYKMLLTSTIVFMACNPTPSHTPVSSVSSAIATERGTIETYRSVKDIPLPNGYIESQYGLRSFGEWLSALPLKKSKTVYLYNGTEKANQSAQFAVLDIPVGDKNLQQCADAVMRLRAGYLFDQKQYDHILFTDNEGGRYPFTSPYTASHFDAYMQRVYGMCGTASLAKQMNTTPATSLSAGDVWIRGGFPGHAVIVMRTAVNESGKKIFLLAQSYMPAQDIHILKNPLKEEQDPWYEIPNSEKLYTPEYTFNENELKTW
jgi:hypothetical protein